MIIQIMKSPTAFRAPPNSLSNRLQKQWIAPVLAVLFVPVAEASPAGQDALNEKLTPAENPALRAAVTVQTATASDLLLALCLALEDPDNAGLTAADLTSSALEQNAITGRVRSDKDKISGQVFATAVSTRDLTASPSQFTATFDAVFRVNKNSSLLNKRLTPTGQANTLAAALKVADASLATALAQTFATTTFDGSEAGLNALLGTTVRSLGTSAPRAQPQLIAFVSGIFQQNIVLQPNRKAFSISVAAKIASVNPAGAGGVLGGFAKSELADDTARVSFALQDVLPNKSLAKAVGEILATTMADHGNKVALETQLITGRSIATQSLITQGILRAGSTAEAGDILSVVLPLVTAKGRAAFTGIVLTRNGEDPAKAKIIVAQIASAQGETGKTAIGVAALNAVGALDPEAAEAITEAVLDVDGGGDFASNGKRLALGQNLASRTKTLATVGFMAKVIVDRNIAGSAAPIADAAVVATSIMVKNPRAATDIAHRTATLTGIPSLTEYADAISDFNKRFVRNAAIGISIADPFNAGLITAAAITHNPTNDKTALSQAPSIAGAVALAVDEESAANIATELSARMSLTGLIAGQPLKVSQAVALATAIGRAIQQRPGVTTLNRMDELGEVAASITANILGKFGADAKALVAEAKAITAVGVALIRVLSKKDLVESKNLLADRSEAQDIAGSIAETIRSVSPARQQALLGTLNGTTLTPGTLTLAMLRALGSAPTATRPNPHYSEVQAAIVLVLQDLGADKYETGSVNDKETDTKNR